MSLRPSSQLFAVRIHVREQRERAEGSTGDATAGGTGQGSAPPVENPVAVEDSVP